MKVTLSKRQIEFIKDAMDYYIVSITAIAGRGDDDSEIMQEAIEKQLNKGIPGHSGKEFKFPGDGR